MMAEIHELNPWRSLLQMGDRGPKRNLTNLMLHLRNLPGMGSQFRFNELSGNVEWKGKPLTDTSYIDVRLQIEAAQYQPTDKDLPTAIMRVAEEHGYNPVADYLNSLTWDGKPRAERWLQRVFGVDDSELHRAFGAMFLISAVARALRPGCKVDTMLILEGEQGIKKSSAVAALFGEEYVLNGLRVFHGQEAGLSVQGRWAVDMGELGGMGKADVRDVKHFLSLTMDNYRPLFGKHFVNRPRRVVFIGSTNEQGYLKDPTGARRFWPVACRTVNLDLLRSCRDQLWAEAVQLFNAGNPWWIEKGSFLEQEATIAQAARFSEDVWAPAINKFLAEATTVMRGCVTAAEVLAAIGVATYQQTRDAEMRVTGHLTHLEWRKKRCMRHGANLNWWFPPEADDLGGEND